MIRISMSQPNGTASFRVEGLAVGPFGIELVRVLGQALTGHRQISLDLESLQSIDQPTLEYLARGRDRFVISGAPRYLSRWLEGLCMIEPKNGAAEMPAPGSEVVHRDP